MALSDLQVFNEYTYSALTEVLDQQIALFNEATRGGIVLQPSAHQGDFSDEAFWKKLSGLVRRRDAYASGAVSAIDLEHLLDTAVKVAAGTPPVNMPPGQFRWIQRSPEEAGSVIGRQLAGDMLQDMLNTAIAVFYASHAQVTALVEDDTAGTVTPSGFVNAAGRFGDRAGAIVCWIIHSKVMHDLYADNMANGERLFVYGTVNVVQDAFGRVFVMTDSPDLITSGAPDTYHTLGMVPGAVVVGQNNDFEQNVETKNGDENILRTYQAEWSFQAGVKGFAWDKTNGGKSPTDAELATGTNWDQYATSNKDLGGVILNTQ